jgi:hypothetical protein
MVHNGKIYIGSDVRFRTKNDEIVAADIESNLSIVQLDGLLIGIAAESPRIKDVIQCYLKEKIPEFKVIENQEKRYLATEFTDAFKSILAENGLLSTDEIGDCFQGSLMLAFSGQLYYVDSHFSVIRCRNEGFAIGVGASVATGVLVAFSEFPEMEPEEKIYKAILATSEVIPGVGHQIYVLSPEENYDDFKTVVDRSELH